jgi:predicted nucleic acid-binding Zn ribbon protein
MRYDHTFVVSLHQFAPAVLAEIIRRQPASKERTAFAWSVAVGPALARVTTVELRGRTLVATARDGRWAREIDRARETILARVRDLVGDTVDRIDVITG